MFGFGLKTLEWLINIDRTFQTNDTKYLPQKDNLQLNILVIGTILKEKMSLTIHGVSVLVDKNDESARTSTTRQIGIKLYMVYLTSTTSPPSKEVLWKQPTQPYKNKKF